MLALVRVFAAVAHYQCESVPQFDGSRSFLYIAEEVAGRLFE